MRLRLKALPILLLVSFGLSSMLIGQDEEAASDELKSFKELKAEYDKGYREFMKAYRAEEDADKKKELLSEMPKIDDYADRVFQIVDAPNSEDVAEALVWLINGVRDNEAKTKAINMMMENHVDSEEIATLAMSMGRAGPSEMAESTIRTIIEKSPHVDVRGKASYTLVQYLTSLELILENAERLEQMSARLSDDDKAYLDGKSLESIKSDLSDLFASIKENYSEVPIRGAKTAGVLLEAMIFEKERLQIGMKVPDIEGEDLDGKEFKLSDYEGKVVVIDFWGDW